MVAPNDILGYYRMIERIGAGGMGEVWKAEDTRLGRIVAIKILPPAVASDQEAIARMRREGRTAAQINHPNIATIYSFEEIGERLFIVMEFVEGEPLTKLIARGGIAEADLCRIGRDVAEALAEAHAKGIIHRDIKPDNIIVSGSRVKVLDFGIAKQMAANAGSNDPTAYMTQQGMIIGTVQYMSPEQALGKTLDPRTDIFSLGIVLYQMATGRLPFQGETVTETITKIVRDEAPDPSALNRSLSANLATIMARCLRKPREQRFNSAADLAAALDRQLAKVSTAPMTTAPPTVREVAPPPPKKRSFAWLGWVTAIVVAVVVAIAVASRQHQAAPATPVSKPATKPATNTMTVTALSGAPAPSPAATAPPPEKKPETEPETRPEPVHAAEGGGAPLKPQESSSFRDGLADLLAGREPQARRELAAAVAADPQDKKARLGLAIANRNWQHAKELARQIHAENPDDPDLQTLRRFLHEVEQQQEQQGRRPHRLRPGVH